MSSLREMTSKSVLVRDPMAEQGALSPLAALARTVLSGDLPPCVQQSLHQIEVSIGVQPGWMVRLERQQIPLTEIDALAVTRLAQLLAVPLSTVFPVNPYKRVIAHPISEPEETGVGKRLGGMDQARLDAVFDRATGALSEGVRASV